MVGARGGFSTVLVSARGGFSTVLLAIVENRGETAAARTYRCQVVVRRAATLLCR